MRRLMEAVGLETQLRERKFTEAGISQVAKTFGSIDAADDTKANELRFAITGMDQNGNRQDGVADRAMQLAQDGDFSGASSLLQEERNRLRRDVEERQELLDQILYASRTVERLIEYDPLYCDTITRRWQAYTGKQAVLSGSSQTFAEIEQQRDRPEPSGVASR